MYFVLGTLRWHRHSCLWWDGHSCSSTVPLPQCTGGNACATTDKNVGATGVRRPTENLCAGWKACTTMAVSQPMEVIAQCGEEVQDAARRQHPLAPRPPPGGDEQDERQLDDL